MILLRTRWPIIGCLAASATLLMMTLIVDPLSPGRLVAAAPTVVRWVAAVDAEAVETHQAQVVEWNKRNTGIQVSFEAWPSSGYVDKIKVMLAAGQAPDMFQLNIGGDVLSLADAGHLLDLRPLYVKTGNLDHYYKPTIDAISSDGRIYGIPREGGPILLRYNISAFHEVGLPLPEPRWDWGRTLDAAKKLVRRDSGGEALRWGLHTYEHWPSWVWSNGGEVIDEAQATGRFSDQASIEALAWLSQLIHSHGVAPPPSEIAKTNGETMFIQGTLAMHSGTRSRWFAISEKAGFDWGMTLLPRGKAGHIPQLAGNVIVIPSSVADPDAVWTFASWMLGVEGWRIRMTLARQIGVPLNRLAVTNELFLRNGNPWLSRETNMMIAQAVSTGRYLPPIPEWPSLLRLAISPSLSQLWRGEIPAEVAATRIDTAIAPLLADRLRASTGSR